WTEDYPVFVTREKLAQLQDVPDKMIIIGDVTCDINGSVVATVKSTEPDNPVFIYNAKTGQIADDFKGEGTANSAVDNLPCEFPREASDGFSRALKPFMERMISNDYNLPIDQSSLPDEMKRAVIAHKGKLEPDFEYLNNFLK
ncbi:MAG: hypothetical protein K8S56_10045, partial [Candidatus Cloacimonetes bacterium]|nr:hypothetical protein [Candidatus Cloacimonadota bacterium]